MSSAIYARIRKNPRFQELVARRGRFAWILAILVWTIFYGFVMVVAFAPKTLGGALGEGSRLTVGVLAELFMFGFFWLLTAFYVYRANGEFDKLTGELIAQAVKEENK